MLRDSLITIAAKVLVFIFGLLGSIVVARMLGPTWRGALALIMLPQVIFLRVAPLGIDRGNIYYCGKEPGRAGDVARYSFWTGLIIGGASLVAFSLYIFTDDFREFAGNLHPGFFIIIAVTFPFLLISLYFDAIIYGRDFIFLRNLKEVFLNALLLLCILAGFFVFHKRLLAPVGASLVVSVAGCGVALALVQRYVTPLKFRGFDWACFRRNFPFGFKNHLSIAAVMLILSAIILLARYRLPHELLHERLDDIAFFTMAGLIFERAMMLPRSIVFALLPKITGADAAEAVKSTLRASRYSILLTLIVFILLYYFIRPLAVILYGVQFEPIDVPFRALAPGAVFLTLGEVWAAGLFARGRVNAILIAGVSGLATAAVAGYFLLNSWSIFGGAVAASLGFFVYALVLLVAFAIEAPFRGKEMFVLSDADIAEIKAKLRGKRL